VVDNQLFDSGKARRRVLDQVKPPNFFQIQSPLQMTRHVRVKAIAAKLLFVLATEVKHPRQSKHAAKMVHSVQSLPFMHSRQLGSNVQRGTILPNQQRLVKMKLFALMLQLSLDVRVIACCHCEHQVWSTTYILVQRHRFPLFLIELFTTLRVFVIN
jgi:hypothetical protein